MALRNINTKEKLPKILKNKSFWADFIDAVSEELQDFKDDQLSQKDNYYYVKEKTDEKHILNVSNSFGYVVDRELNSTLEYLKNDVLSIPFRIKYKSSYLSYDYIFKSIPYSGEIFIYFWNGLKLTKDFKDFDSIAFHDVTTPYIFEGKKDYLSFILEYLYFDADPVLYFDDDENPWYFDQESVKVKTNHLCIEYCMDQLITVNSVEYGMVKNYLDFLLRACLYTRRVTNVIHAGVQVVSMSDNSGYYDNAFLSYNDYSIPTIKLRSSTLSGFDFDTTIASKIAIGIGSQGLVSKYSGGIAPTSLQTLIAIKTLDFSNRGQEGDWKLAFEEFDGNTVLEEWLEVGDGSTTIFAGTLDYYPVIPGSVEIQYESFPDTFLLTDNKKDGILYDNGIAKGVIDYDTGDYTITTLREYNIPSEILATDSVTNITTTLTNFPVVENTFKIYYKIGSQLFEGFDNGSGIIVGTGISSGSINYTNGQINITFTNPTDALENVYCTYEYAVLSPPDLGSDITALIYSVETNLNITEAGLFDQLDNMIAYMTFPPINLGSRNYHIGIHFFYYNGSWT